MSAGEQGPAKLPPHWLSLLLENLSDTVLVMDREGCIRYWNRGAEETFQYGLDEVIGRHVAILHVPTEDNEFEEARDLALRGDIISNLEVLERRKDGKTLTLLLSIVPILGDSGEVEYLAGIGKDITIVRSLQEKVLAGEKLDTVREMIITLNHKMNQPLAVASCYLGMLQDRNRPLAREKQLEYLGEIESQLDRVAALLRRIAEMEEIKTVQYLAENRMVEVDEDSSGG